MNFNFGRFFWNLFPYYYKQNDTYIDSSGKGLMERYMELFGEEIDEKIIPAVEYWLDIIGADAPDQDKYYNHQAYTYGNPPISDYSDFVIYRRVLEFIISVYKVKGTLLGYQSFFRLIGFTVVVIPNPCPPAVRYDEGFAYDDDFIYDQTGCCKCTELEISITGRAPYSTDPITQDDADLIDKIKDFLTPINVTATVTY